MLLLLFRAWFLTDMSCASQLFKHLMVLSYMFLSAMTQYHYGYLIDKCANMKLISYLLFVNQDKDM